MWLSSFVEIDWQVNMLIKAQSADEKRAEGLAHLGYPIFTPDGNERPLWEVGDDQPTVTEKLVLAHVSLGLAPPRPVGS